MPIDVSEFNEKGKDAVRVGFGGEQTKNIVTLLESQDAAFSLTEVADAAGVDSSDKKALHNLTNLLYGQRKKGKVVMKVVDGEKYYVAASNAE